MSRVVHPRGLRLTGCLLALLTATAHGAEPVEGHAYAPKVAAASGDADRALRTIRVPKGLRLELFAAEPLLANPVAFGFDEKGRAFVVETFRLHDGVTDTRGHMNWLDDDMACRTVADRVAMYRKHLGKEAESYGKAHDRIRRIEDRDGDGKADHATVFTDGYNELADGLGAGVLARKGDVYFTCIPDLWRLRDADGDGKAEVKESLHTGYGVHVNFLGHDLHGLRFGPDGKLYFTIGDRGLNVKTKDRALFLPDTGAVLRCNPDGSELELFATGLRNPQELAFDQYGNLFTCDNNSDSGDKARWVHLVEGGDSGWRVGYQYLEWPVSRGPWNAEKLWHLRWDDQAAYLLPPLAHISDGPSGLTYDPGVTLLPERYKDHFFLCDFRGGSGQSGVRSLAVKPKGASFEVVDSEQFVWSVLATDVEFGPDGALYVSDWVEGWNLTGKGRLFKLSDPSRATDPRVPEVKRLLGEGMGERSPEELARLLTHADMRVRQEAQFALAEGRALDALARVARESENSIARLHAIWGLGQLAKTAPEAVEASVVPLLGDRDAEVRAQAAKVAGEGRFAKAGEPLRRLTKDDSPRVRFFAALALGKLARRESLESVLALLRENADRDVYLRHAGVMALTGIGRSADLLAAANDPSPAVRIGVLLALRRLGRPEVGRFLEDREPRLVLEAVRAIYDEPILDAFPALAALATRSNLSEPLGRRVALANARLAQPANAEALVRLATQNGLPEHVRVEALDLLRDWGKPIGRDPLMGVWRPQAGRSVEVASRALAPAWIALATGAPEAVRQAAVQVVGTLAIPEPSLVLVDLVSQRDRAVATRIEALKALGRLHDARLSDAVKQAMADREPKLRVEGQKLLAQLRPAEALPVLEVVLRDGTVAERQNAIGLLGGIPGEEADRILSGWLDRMLEHQAPPELELDLLEAAGRRKSGEVVAKRARLESSRAQDDPLSPYRETLVGGDAQRGEKIFKEKADVSCLRCHKVKGQGGEVGPELAGVGTRHDRRYLLESIVTPNRQIAQGFETLVLAMADGQVITGILKHDEGKALRLVTADGKAVQVAKDQIEERKRGDSAMPADLLKHLSKNELRDLMEFLATVK